MSLIARLLEAGTPPELIEEVAMLLAEKRVAEQAILQRRANDRERTARSRGNVTSRDNTGHDVTERDAPALSRPPNENNSNPPTHTHPVCENPPARKAHRLPADWAPKPLPADLATAVQAWPVGAIERELSKFRDWAASAPGKSGLKADWDAAWRNWLRRRIDEGIEQNGRSNITPLRRTGGESHDRRSGLARAIDEGLEWLG